MGIGSRIAYNDTKLEPNMVLSNEPGYYQDGEFGIRIESLVVVKQEKTMHEFGGVKYYGMEHLTMVSSNSFVARPGARFSGLGTRGQERNNTLCWTSRALTALGDFSLHPTKLNPPLTHPFSSSAPSRRTSSTLRSCRSTSSSGSTSTTPKSETKLGLCCARPETTRRSSKSRSGSHSQSAFSLSISSPHPRSLIPARGWLQTERNMFPPSRWLERNTQPVSVV
jgi:hypothetical protein